MRSLNVVWDIKTIPISAIDLRESQINGARIRDPFVPELVEDYKQGFLNGDAFPRLIVWKGAAGYVILSGNQRCKAISELIAEKDVDKSVGIECYVVETDKMTREIIARSANAAHGGRTTKEERILHAAYCVRSLGMAVTDAAKIFMVSKTTINHHINADNERSSLLKAGVDATRMSVASLSSLAALGHDDKAKTSIASLAVSHDVPADQVKSIVQGIAAEKTLAGRTNRIKEFERSLVAQARATAKSHHKNGNGKSISVKAPSRPRRDKLLDSMKRLVDFLEHGNDGQSFASLDELQFSGGDDNKQARALADKLKLRLKVLKI